ncbi:unnamed protein product [Polarella glacialis]|uniref:Cystatin domain-containing protein n=1 Tax=Polarella glacialis TaxID=89957 RepID=A0A813E1Z9_POLGL|nr:unnamed protein product [Polarella glacialis]CAE8630189.1 unnamed protein product [Polarella glacialis]CAE8680817.1 unnamed protein product [Polarella glacialis]|eukprot:CAMPEP_0115081224 /NCGR_PEP_ID=MMETSP0227-20121206/19137_1 /TAXON_ID=89957 /ORGANISM="Polarella glacialis, Strain CCMP 1383" /LENGTH=138 /DNA_ID=CAMNT_0002468999 /DNA_START=67 /DNA_END=483 /DNA_ORIENTATION=-
MGSKLLFAAILASVAVLVASFAGSQQRTAGQSSPMPGGISGGQDATPEVQALCDKVKSDAVAALASKDSNLEVTEFKAISFATQVVAGINYVVKLEIGAGKYAHLCIFEPLPLPGNGPARLTGVRLAEDSDALNLHCH